MVFPLSSLWGQDGDNDESLRYADLLIFKFFIIFVGNDYEKA